MNLASHSLGCRVISFSSEVLECEAFNVLDNDLSRIWLSDNGSPQWLCVSLSALQRDDVEIRSIGWHCWHAYSTNPRDVRVHVSSDGTKFRVWDTFTAKCSPGIQLFCCAPISTALYPYISLEILNTFGGAQTYLNRLFLFSDEVAGASASSFLSAPEEHEQHGQGQLRDRDRDDHDSSRSQVSFLQDPDIPDVTHSSTTSSHLLADFQALLGILDKDMDTDLDQQAQDDHRSPLLDAPTPASQQQVESLASMSMSMSMSMARRRHAAVEETQAAEGDAGRLLLLEERLASIAASLPSVGTSSAVMRTSTDKDSAPAMPFPVPAAAVTRSASTSPMRRSGLNSINSSSSSPMPLPLTSAASGIAGSARSTSTSTSTRYSRAAAHVTTPPASSDEEDAGPATMPSAEATRSMHRHSQGTAAAAAGDGDALHSPLSSPPQRIQRILDKLSHLQAHRHAHSLPLVPACVNDEGDGDGAEDIASLVRQLHRRVLQRTIKEAQLQLVRQKKVQLLEHRHHQQQQRTIGNGHS